MWYFVGSTNFRVHVDAVGYMFSSSNSNVGLWGNPIGGIRSVPLKNIMTLFNDISSLLAPEYFEIINIIMLSIYVVTYLLCLQPH